MQHFGSIWLRVTKEDLIPGDLGEIYTNLISPNPKTHKIGSNISKWSHFVQFWSHVLLSWSLQPCQDGSVRAGCTCEASVRATMVETSESYFDKDVSSGVHNTYKGNSKKTQCMIQILKWKGRGWGWVAMVCLQLILMTYFWKNGLRLTFWKSYERNMHIHEQELHPNPWETLSNP